MLTAFDLFSGGGGFRQGAEKAGVKISAFCEIDKWATKFYRNAFNTEGEVYFNDATKIDTRELPDFDLLLAGFPCQAFSIAGKRRGFEDSRGTMFFEVARILRDKRPKYFILENVKGLLNHDSGKTFQTILTILSDIGIYSVEWALLNSKHFGVPQNRERVFIVGYPREYGIGKVFPLGGANATVDEIGPQLIGNVNPSGRGQNGTVYATNAISPTLTCNKGEGIKIGTLRTHKIDGGFRETADNQCPCIPARAREDGSGQPVIQISPVLTPGRIEKRQNGRRIKNPGEEMFTLTGQDIHGVYIHSANSKGYEVAEDGDSINISYPDSKTRRGRVGKQTAQTLETGGNMATYYQGCIRRLTPLECFRLQGFSDEVFKNGSHGVSDAQLYKIAGNSVTVNVVYEIAKKIVKMEKVNEDESKRSGKWLR